MENLITAILVFARGDYNPSSMVSVLGFESEDPGFNPQAWQGERQFFCPSESTLVQTSLCLTPLCVSGMYRQICAHNTNFCIQLS
jgi:hypothetical protein